MELISYIFNSEIAFDGWVVALISAIVSLVLGGAWTYKRFTSSNIAQKQKAKKKASQRQKARSSSNKDFNNINQEQEAGDNSNQIQQIGDNSTQMNIDKLILNIKNNHQSKDILYLAETVSTQATKQALALCTQVSEDICRNRIASFEKQWIPAIIKMENAVDNLIDPKFQFMIRDANISAAKSSREEDLDILTRMLICHIENESNMIIDTAVNKAIQIVSEVDYESLCGLTCLELLMFGAPAIEKIDEGLQHWDYLFSKLLYTNLPCGDDWYNHLHILGAVIAQYPSHFTPFKNLITKYWDGNICVGIKKESEEYQTAIDFLTSASLSTDLLVENELMPGYLRLTILQKNYRPILNLYSKDDYLLDQVYSNFLDKWDSFENLKIIREWYEKIPSAFIITKIGSALAQTNAKRLIPDFPDLI